MVGILNLKFVVIVGEMGRGNQYCNPSDYQAMSEV